jgi:hypothetical protein
MEGVSELISISNDSALETMSLAAHFVASHDIGKIIDHWDVLAELGSEHVTVEDHVSSALDHLMTDFGFTASVAMDEAEIRRWPPTADKGQHRNGVPIG